jgi:hypothetical protein
MQGGSITESPSPEGSLELIVGVELGIDARKDPALAEGMGLNPR